jgi:hypothetical protein
MPLAMRSPDLGLKSAVMAFLGLQEWKEEYDIAVRSRDHGRDRIEELLNSELFHSQGGELTHHLRPGKAFVRSVA